MFIKFVQSLGYEELADAVAEMGADGIEATVRKGGYIAPERAAQELPKLADAMAKRNLKITMITTDVVRVDDPNTRPVLQTAAKLGIPMYRMGFYKYDLKRPVLDQLEAIGPALKELGALNAELGIQAVYQNHSGAEHVGGTVWDIYGLIKDIPKEQIAPGVRYSPRDDRGRPLLADRVQRDAAADRDGVCERFRLGRAAAPNMSRSARAASTGRSSSTCWPTDSPDRFRCMSSTWAASGTQENLAALRRDLGVLRGWLQS